MYYLCTWNWKRTLSLVLVGAIYKAVYSGVAFYHWGMGTLPNPIFALFSNPDVIGQILYF